MHELSIALSIVDVASEELARQGDTRAEVIYLRLGPLSGVVKEALRSAFELASENSPVAGARLEIEDEPVEIECSTCGGPQEVESISEMRCRTCGTLSANVIRGRALEVTAMEISNDPVRPDQGRQATTVG
jgi:hydrogenase nickel incorporation protein HypA/HybF